MYRILLPMAFALGLLLYSCNDQSLDELKMGQEYINDESGIVLIDTFSLELSTVLIDSVQTSGISSLMAGKYFHEVFGEIESEPVFNVGVPSRYDFDEDDVFDSITICMDYTNYYLGDTSSIYSLDVMELDTDFEDLDQTAFYNRTRVKVKGESLGHITNYPRPNKGETLETKLKDSFGEQLFDLFINDADEIEDLSSFQEYFKGVVLQNSASNQSVMNFAQNDTSLCFKMYYHRIEGEKKELKAVFSMSNSANMFNQIKSNNSETLFAPLVTQDESILSKKTNNVTMVQGSTGLMTKVKFPGLANVFQLVKLDQIIKAELVLVPTEEAEDINDLPTQLVVYESNKINKLNSIYSGGTLQLYSATDNYESNPYYSIDITDYIISTLITGYFNSDNALLIGLSSDALQSTFSTVMFGGENNTNYTPKLNIYTYYY